MEQRRAGRFVEDCDPAVEATGRHPYAPVLPRHVRHRDHRIGKVW